MVVFPSTQGGNHFGVILSGLWPQFEWTLAKSILEEVECGVPASKRGPAATSEIRLAKAGHGLTGCTVVCL